MDGCNCTGTLNQPAADRVAVLATNRALHSSRTHRRVACSNSPDRLQSRLDRGPPWLEKRRQREFLAERVHRLVAGKARAVGCDLEQDAVRLAEIEAAEIEPVDL